MFNLVKTKLVDRKRKGYVVLAAYGRVALRIKNEYSDRSTISKTNARVSSGFQTRENI